MSSAPLVSDWFRLEDYACVSSFGLAEWYVALDIRLGYDIGGEETRRDDLNEFWREYLSRTRPTNVTKLLASDEYRSIFEPSQAVEEVPLDDFHRDEKVAEIRKYMILLGKRMLLIDRAASDRMILKEFREWLGAHRASDPLPIRHKGETRITEGHLHSWHNYKVLACFDLDYWAKVFHRRPVPYEQLCNIAFDPTYPGNSKEWGREARRKTKEAMLSLQTLRLQIPGGMK